MEHPSEHRAIWYSVLNEKSTAPSSVYVHVTSTISDLTKAINKDRRNLRLSGIPNMLLLKPSVPIPIKPAATLKERIEASDFVELDDPSVTVLDGFPESLPNHVHIIVKNPSPSPEHLPPHHLSEACAPGIIRKRGANLEDTGRDAKRMKTNLQSLPSEEALNVYHTMLQDVSDDPHWYSDPRNFGSLPFPFIYGHQPERFSLAEGKFEYMGREIFQEAYEKVTSLKLYGGLTQLYIEGTMGYGKSHVLAALVCLLRRQGRLVIFIPDCRAMARGLLHYVKSALLCAFAGPSLKERRDEIRDCSTKEEILHLLDDQTPYFVIDQVNAFEPSDVNTDSIPDAVKMECWKFILEFTSGCFLITSSLASYKTANHMVKDQTGDAMMSVKGEMSHIEMEQWWHHHETKVPKFESDEERAMVEDLTGCVPLLLQPLLSLGQQNFCDVEGCFRSSPEILAVGRNIKMFARSIMVSDERAYHEYIDNMFKCITQPWAPMDTLTRSFDYRYFFHRPNTTGTCTSGLAREAATLVIAQHKRSKLYSSEWICRLSLLKNKPTALGALVALTCLSCIADFGINFGKFNIVPQVPIFFEGCLDDLLNIIHNEKFEKSSSRFYIPLDAQFEDINGVYIQYRERTNTVTVIPIQITINECHKDSEWLFYKNWNKWKMIFSEYNLATVFVWVVETRKSWKELNEVVVSTRQSGARMPARKRAVIPAKILHRKLGNQLEHIREVRNA